MNLLVSTKSLFHGEAYEELPLLNHSKNWNDRHISKSEVFQMLWLPGDCDGCHPSYQHLKKPVLMQQMSLGQPNNHEQFETELEIVESDTKI